MQRESVEEAEANAYKKLAIELERHNRFAVDAFNLVGHTTAAVPDRMIRNVPESCRVSTLLLNRVSNDLRAVTQLVNHGYAIQGLALVSALYEAAFTIPFIGTNDDVALQWIDHRDFKRSFRDAMALTRGGLHGLGFPNPDEQAKTAYMVYRQCCLAKHTNPLLQSQHGIALKDNTFRLFNGPDTSEATVRVSWYALQHASALAAFVATAGFIRSHVSADRAQPLIVRIRELDQLLNSLDEAAKTKWGTESPFPEC